MLFQEPRIVRKVGVSAPNVRCPPCVKKTNDVTDSSRLFNNASLYPRSTSIVVTSDILAKSLFFMSSSLRYCSAMSFCVTMSNFPSSVTGIGMQTPFTISMVTLLFSQMVKGFRKNCRNYFYSKHLQCFKNG